MAICSAAAVLVAAALILGASLSEGSSGTTAVGDPGMARDGLRVAFEAWNFCNEVGEEAPGMGTPRAADCFDLNGTYLVPRVKREDNKLGVGQPIPAVHPQYPAYLHNPDLYAAEKELYLGSLCQVERPKPWQFWTVMLKNGNYYTKSGLCPQNGVKQPPFASKTFPCFGKGCMNQPKIRHGRTRTYALGSGHVMRGHFNGTYDLHRRISDRNDGSSYFAVAWEKTVGSGSWVFRHKLRTSAKYPWLMLYLRADATQGFSGGYHYQSRGMLHTLPESPRFIVKLKLNVRRGGGKRNQFYLIDIGSCWKNDGMPCDGDTSSDVTRYSEMILNPEVKPSCSSKKQMNCPPYHISHDGARIYRNDTARFPYNAYHYYCAPGNARHLDLPTSTCDPYSNPQAQELVQLLPHHTWGVHGLPIKLGEGWVGDPRSWVLDVGGLSSRLYFYQDPHTRPARRIWSSIDVGAEIYGSEGVAEAEWSVTEFNVILT